MASQLRILSQSRFSNELSEHRIVFAQPQQVGQRGDAGCACECDLLGIVACERSVMFECGRNNPHIAISRVATPTLPAFEFAPSVRNVGVLNACLKLMGQDRRSSNNLIQLTPASGPEFGTKQFSFSLKGDREPVTCEQPLISNTLVVELSEP
jgi:hypothetical protein